MSVRQHKMISPQTLLAAALSIAMASCKGPASNAEQAPMAQHGPLLRMVPADSSGIRFANTLTESPTVNFYTYEYAYNGGGVAVGDVNNDGLVDVYFTGNQVPDRLYLNRGGLHFEDVTDKAIGITAGAGWRTGVSMADVNADGWLDLYVCRGGPTQDTSLTRNLFYLNRGDGTFDERAQAWADTRTPPTVHRHPSLISTATGIWTST